MKDRDKSSLEEAVPDFPKERQFVHFAFYKLQPNFWSLETAKRAAANEEFQKTIAAFADKITMSAYSLFGIRADCDLLLWKIAYELEAFEKIAGALHQTLLGRYLIPAYFFLSQTRRSIYRDKLDPDHPEKRLKVVPGSGKYLFVYPFVKTRAWYRLSQEERQRMMDEHILIGSKYTSVKLHTTYSFGLDDQEFVVAFETDSPSDFLDLVMELRDSEASSYTLQDTPIFTCIARTLPNLLNALCPNE